MSKGRLAACTLLFSSALVLPAAFAAPAAIAAGGSYGGYSTGSVVYANAANLPPVDIAKVSLAQSAAGVGVGQPLVTQDQTKTSILNASTTGKNAYGHGAGANVGLLQGQTKPAQIQLSTAEALSPPPMANATKELLHLPLAPLATADLLPSHAAANTTSADNACVTGTSPISEGDAHVANANVLTGSFGTNGAAASVLAIGNTVDSTSQTLLGGPAAGATGRSLTTETTQNVAPITLFQGISGAQVTIKVLAPIELQANAGGVPGSASVHYGFAGISPTDNTTPVLSITAGGSTQTLTSQQLFGNGGVKLALGVADVTIGTPAHSLTGNETTSPSVAADGTSASAAADFIRVTVPGNLPVPQNDPVGGPLGQVLNPILNPVVSGLAPILKQIQQGLTSAGLNVADVRVGHLEAQTTVPTGGIDCSTPTPPPSTNPFSEAMKDVSALTAAPGATFNYTVRFPNRGDQEVTNVVVTDTYTGGPPALQFVSSVPAPTSQQGNVLTYQIGTLQPGQYAQITLTFKVPSDAPAGTVYHNHAVISGSYAGKPTSQTVDVNGPTVQAPGGGGCNLGFSTKYASNKQVKTGEDFAYYVNVANSGGQACSNVAVSDPLPSGVTFVSCSNSCTHSGNTVTWNLGTIAPGQSEVVSVVVKVTATSGTLPNTAHITASNGSPANPSTPGPTVSGVSVVSPGSPAGCVGTQCPAVLGENAARGQLAFTGLDTAIPLAGVLLFLVSMGLLRRRRTE